MADATPLRFHVPEPEVRPGGQPDFSKVVIPEAGLRSGALRVESTVLWVFWVITHSGVAAATGLRRPAARWAPA